MDNFSKMFSSIPTAPVASSASDFLIIASITLVHFSTHYQQHGKYKMKLNMSAKVSMTTLMLIGTTLDKLRRVYSESKVYSPSLFKAAKLVKVIPTRSRPGQSRSSSIVGGIAFPCTHLFNQGLNKPCSKSTSQSLLCLVSNREHRKWDSVSCKWANGSR